MQAILRLRENHRLRAFQYVFADLQPAIGWEAVQHDRMFGGGGQQCFIDADSRRNLSALGFFCLLAHADPGVGVDHVGIRDRRQRVVAWSGNSCRGTWDMMRWISVGGEFVSRRGGEDETHPESAAGDREGAGDVVAVADEGKGSAGRDCRNVLPASSGRPSPGRDG